MTQQLPPAAQRLLSHVARVVPSQDRTDWLRGWEAELWHAHFGSQRKPGRWFYADLSVGLTLDAFWLRRESWRQAWSGTAGFCLVCLAALCLLAMGIGAELTDGTAAWRNFSTMLTHAAFAIPLVLFVGCATGWHTSSPRSAGAMLTRFGHGIRRSAFLAVKTSLTLVLAGLLSADLFLPFYPMNRGMSDVLQELTFVLLALVGLRWSFEDHEQRCKDCLRSLASPERVGRPSHNLLEWSGTEQICVLGHGALSSPEMISSWCERSRWSERPAGWDPAIAG